MPLSYGISFTRLFFFGPTSALTTSSTTDNPVAAAQTAQGIFERAQVLKAHPEIDHRYLASSRNVRILLYGHYRIAYLVREDGNIDILGVFHGSLDISRYQI